MTAPDHVVLGVLRATATAGLSLSITEADLVSAALLDQFPGMAETDADRAHWSRWTPADELTLADLYTAGEPVTAIAEQLGRTPGAVRGCISRLRLTRRTDQETPDGT